MVTDEGHGPEPEGVSPSGAWLADDEVIRVLEFAKWVANRLGMPAYRWMFGEEPSEEDCHASINVSSKRYVGVIKVNPRWADYETRVKAESIVHEVLHAFMSRLDEVWDQTVFNEHVPTSHALVLQRVWTREMELVVDLLTMYVYKVEEIVEAWESIDPSEVDGQLTAP